MNLSVRTYSALVLLILILLYILSGAIHEMPVLGDISDFIARLVDSVVGYITDVIRDAMKDVLRDATEEAFDQAEQAVQEQIDDI